MATIRRYTLLSTVSTDGSPVQLTTTQPAGATLTVRVDGRPELFELTDVRLYDGTFAAEPLDWDI